MTDPTADAASYLSNLADRVLAIHQTLQLHEQRLTRQESDTADHREAIIQQSQAAIDQSNAVISINEHLAGQHELVLGHLGAIRNDLDRIIPQVESLERRVEGLRADFERRAGGIEVSSSAYADQILAEAQREHELARLKLELASHYEERLRRLERVAESSVGVS